MAEIESILKQYGDKLDDAFDERKIPKIKRTQEYKVFRNEMIGRRITFYESLCNSTEKILTVQPKDPEKLNDAIQTVHLNITPQGASSFATFLSLAVTLLAIIFGIVLFVFGKLGLGMALLVMGLILVALLMIGPLTKIPIYIADRWRMKASNQMVLCILYVMMFMRHTSNLEHAIQFAANHLRAPLALDLRKVLWDVETGKFSTIKEALDRYILTWRKTAPDFVQSFHLIISSLYEPNNDRRMTLLDKSLEVMLDGTYERMLHFTHDLRNPIQLLHMLGVVLPILGLVIFPLVGSLLGGSGTVKMIILFVLYNICLPIVVFLLGLKILSKRPTGYSTDAVLSKEARKRMQNIQLPFGISMSPLWIASGFMIAFVIIGTMPLILHAVNPSLDFSLSPNVPLPFFDYKDNLGGPCQPDRTCFGPFGVGATLLGLLIPLSLGLGIGWYYTRRTKKLMVLKKETMALEKEFSAALFQLGNRIGDGVPAEAAFGAVAKAMRGSNASRFFNMVHANVVSRGMKLEDAIFEPEHGALRSYPSRMIASSMKILVESAKKGPQIVARTLMGISAYLTKIHRVNERLKDLMADITSSMKSQIMFLTPIIAGIVVGIGVMIVTIMGGLQNITTVDAASGENDLGVGSITALVDLFRADKLIPSYFFQLIVGIYVVQVVVILSFLVSGVEFGPDKVIEQSTIGKNLKSTLLFYFLVTLIAVGLLSVLVVIVMSGFT